MCGKFSQIHPAHWLFVCYKKWLVLTEQSIHGNDFNSCSLMLTTNYRCVQSPNISFDVAKCGRNFRKFTQYTYSLSVTKNNLSSLNNLFMVMIQLMRMSSSVNNKLQMCSVIQLHFRRRQMWAKFSQIYPVHSLLFHLTCHKMTCLD